MVDVLSSVEDLRCLNVGSEEELKDRLKEEFLDYVSVNDIDFTWVSDRHIIVDGEDYESVEDDIVALLQGVYEEYIDDLLGEEL